MSRSKKDNGDPAVPRAFEAAANLVSAGRPSISCPSGSPAMPSCAVSAIRTSRKAPNSSQWLEADFHSRIHLTYGACANYALEAPLAGRGPAVDSESSDPVSPSAVKKSSNAGVKYPRPPP